MIQLDSSKRRILKGNNFLCIGFLNGSSFNQQTYFRYKKLRSQIFVGFNLFMIIGTFNFYDIAMGWERNTHKELTQKAIEIIEIVDPNFDTYLIDNLGLKGGFGESIDGTTVKEWVIEGGDLEDGTSDFSLRPRTHFHEPTTNTGLFGSFESAIEWSLKPVGTQDAEESYSWQDARDYFFRALTSETEKSRDENWGRTFRALGQIMHLLQDSANPSHVRDDAHISALGIGQVDGLHDYMARQSVASFPGSTFFTPDPSLLRTIHTEGPSDSLANLFDTNTYRGNNPGATLGNDVGIAEFTNANFFSDDTIPGQGETNLPFPNVLELVPAAVPLPYLTLSRLGSPSFPASRAAKLTGNQAAAQFLQTNTTFDLIGQLQLDNGVYDAQAKNLIPRAIDYSAEVLNYFFRDTIPITESRYCFQPGNPNQVSTYLIDIEILISSLDPPTEFHDGGTFSAYLERPNGEREFMSEAVWDSSQFLGELFGLGGFIEGDDLGHPNPITVVIVYDGKLGPEGAEEPRGIVGKTHMITDFSTPCLL